MSSRMTDLRATLRGQIKQLLALNNEQKRLSDEMGGSIAELHNAVNAAYPSGGDGELLSHFLTLMDDTSEDVWAYAYDIGADKVCQLLDAMRMLDKVLTLIEETKQ